MRAEMQRYFTGERRGGYWLMGAAVPALGLGAGLLARDGAYERGLAYTLIGFGAVEAIGGLAFVVNTRRRVPRFERQLSGDPAAYRAAELPRIRGVNGQMRFLEALEISLILGGGAMTGAGLLQGQDTLAGVGTGLMIEALVLLIYDQLAARRALRYTDHLERFAP